MPQNPLISTIIPTFNSSPYIARCLDSILNQSIKDIEILAIDDQSTDNTVEILLSYREQFSNIKVVKLEKKVLSGGARNVGLKIAKGKYISFVDSDDWIDTNYYYHLLHSIENCNADISICGVKREYENSKNSTVRYRYDVSNVVSGWYALSLLSRVIDQDVAISAIVCNKLYKSDFIKKHNLIFFENCVNEDDIFVFHSFFKAKNVSITDKTNYHLYQRKNSISREFSRKHIDDLFFAFNEIQNLLRQNNAFEKMKSYYYAFFEKCFSYVIESMKNSVQDEAAINSYFKYAYVVSRNVILIDDFIDYCGHRRLIDFFEH
jgi:glycosyltransferase involved in cell wall biosynthesis